MGGKECRDQVWQGYRCGGGTGAPPEAVVVGELFGKFFEWQMASISRASTLATVFCYRHYPSSSGFDLRSFIVVLKVVYFLFGSLENAGKWKEKKVESL